MGGKQVTGEAVTSRVLAEVGKNHFEGKVVLITGANTGLIQFDWLVIGWLISC